jgi:putative aldouronate transport system permease protein
MSANRTWLSRGLGLCKVSFLMLVLLVTLFPFLNIAAVSLSDEVHILKNEIWIIPKGTNVNAYATVLKDTVILRAYRNTVVYVVVGTAVAMSITTTGAFALSRSRMVLRRGFALLLVFTMLFNGGMIPTYLAVKSLGLLDTMWSFLLLGSAPAWYVFLMRSFFHSIPKELEEAGTIDGLNDLGILWRIFLPLSKAALATFSLFYAVGIWNTFFEPFIYFQTPRKYPLQVILRQLLIANEFRLSEMNAMGETMLLPESLKAATIMISTLPILLVYPLIQKYFVKGIIVGAVKG